MKRCRIAVYSGGVFQGFVALTTAKHGYVDIRYDEKDAFCCSKECAQETISQIKFCKIGTDLCNRKTLTISMEEAS